MSARWLSIRVELVSGRGQGYDPPPGRVFAVPPSASFDDLAQAIDTAFGRWDLAHLHQFTLADGTEVSDPEPNDEAVDSPYGPISKTLPLTVRISGTLSDGDRFGYVFDFGDQWTHQCVVEGPADRPAPAERQPVITWGWGSLPDQYGRRWADDDGVSEPPPRDEALSHDQHQPGPIDLRAFRVAVHAADSAGLVDAISGVELDHALQQIGAGLLRTQLGPSARNRQTLDGYLLSVHNRLQERAWTGDPELAELILTVLQQGAAPEVLRVDLDDLISAGGAQDQEPGGYVNSATGAIVPAFFTDEATVGEDAVVDVEGDERIYLDEDDSRDRWQDMADFAATQQPAV